MATATAKSTRPKEGEEGYVAYESGGGDRRNNQRNPRAGPKNESSDDDFEEVTAKKRVFKKRDSDDEESPKRFSGGKPQFSRGGGNFGNRGGFHRNT